MLFCGFCRHASINFRRIQSDQNKKGYILSCKKCESEHGLEDVPTYVLSPLREFCEQRKTGSLSPTVITVENDGSEYIQFFKEGSQYLKKEELKLIADEIYKTLDLDHSLDQFIKESNIRNNLEHFYSYSEKDRNRFQIPYSRLGLSKRHFDSNKNKWSFRCGNCSDLINIDVQESYYTIVPQDLFYANNDRGCSKGCTKVIVKDIIKNWLHSSSLKTYFYTDDIDEELVDLIRKA